MPTAPIMPNMKIGVPPSTNGGTIAIERAELRQQRHDDKDRPGGRDDEAAADAGQRDRADVLIVRDQRHTAEQGSDRRAQAVGRDDAAEAAFAGLDLEHVAERERDAHGVDRGYQVIDDDAVTSPPASGQSMP